MKLRTFAAGGLLALLFGCGGGGGPVVPAPEGDESVLPVIASYDMNAAFTRLLTTGARFSGLNGTFAGVPMQLELSFTPATDGLFQGQTYRRAIQSNIATAGGMQNSTSQTMYFTVSPVQLVGAIDDSGPLTVFAPQGTLPTAGTAGQSGPYAFATSYASTSSSTVIGQTRVTWELQPDTDTTVWACLTMTLVDGPLSEQDCFRLDAAGNVSGARAVLFVDGQTVVFSQ
jgi:hypothetical protein